MKTETTELGQVTRRAILAGAVATPLAVTAPVALAAENDAALIAADKEWRRLQKISERATIRHGEACEAVKERYPESPKMSSYGKPVNMTRAGIRSHYEHDFYIMLRRRDGGQEYPWFVEGIKETEARVAGLTAELETYEAACEAVDRRAGIPALNEAANTAWDAYCQACERFTAIPASTVKGVALKLRASDDMEQLSTGDGWSCELLQAALGDAECLAGRTM